MKVITITGSVGTGKTTIAKKLSKKLNYKYIDINKLITENKLSSGYDKKKKCKIIDTKKLNKFLVKNIINNKEFIKKNKGIIIDSHLSHYLPKKYVNLCIVTKCDLKELSKRLNKRKYSKNKIKENIECEIFDICYNEAKDFRHKTIVINTSKSPKGFLMVSKQNVTKITKPININTISRQIRVKLK